MPITPEPLNGLTVAQRARLFNDRSFVDLISGYALKSLITFIMLVVLGLLTAIGVYYQLIWFFAGITAISLITGTAAASFTDFVSRVRTVRSNRDLIPKAMHNHFIKVFTEKR